jgi:hypothetical protein
MLAAMSHSTAHQPDYKEYKLRVMSWLLFEQSHDRARGPDYMHAGGNLCSNDQVCVCRLTEKNEVLVSSYEAFLSD